MDKKGFVRMGNSLFFKVYRNYGVMLVVFAVLIGAIFINLYSKVTMESYRDLMEGRAKSTSDRVSEFVMDDYYGTYYSAFLEVLEDFDTSDIWILSNPGNPMKERYTNADMVGIDVEGLEQLVKEVFAGGTSYLTEYSEIYGTNMVCVGVPIYGADGSVVGAVLVNSAVESQKAVISQSISMVFISALAALLISFIIAVLLASQLSRPISHMRHVALSLANGKYQTRTGIHQKDEIGQLAGAVDILAERLEAAEEERKNLEQMRRDFFANVSHELRTPITVIRAYTESLVDGVVEEGRLYQYYDRMLSECKSMERLIGDLLMLSKMQNPDFEIEDEQVNIVQVFDDILRSAKTIAVKKQLQIRLDKNREVCMVQGDYDRLRQMFMIILDNAIKFSTSGESIFITITAGVELIVSIRDTGIGISVEELPYIFDKFYRSKLRQNAGGSGLGLAIARQIAMKHGGTIEPHSELGRGAEFIFTLPMVRSGTGEADDMD